MLIDNLDEGKTPTELHTEIQKLLAQSGPPAKQRLRDLVAALYIKGLQQAAEVGGGAFRAGREKDEERRRVDREFAETAV